MGANRSHLEFSNHLIAYGTCFYFVYVWILHLIGFIWFDSGRIGNKHEGPTAMKGDNIVDMSLAFFRLVRGKCTAWVARDSHFFLTHTIWGVQQEWEAKRANIEEFINKKRWNEGTSGYVISEFALVSQTIHLLYLRMALTFPVNCHGFSQTGIDLYNTSCWLNWFLAYSWCTLDAGDWFFFWGPSASDQKGSVGSRMNGWMIALW